MKLFSLLPRRLSHFACNSPPRPAAANRGSSPKSPVFHGTAKRRPVFT